MNIKILSCCFLLTTSLSAAPHFVVSQPLPAARYYINGAALCFTAKETLAYLNKGPYYDLRVIHVGNVVRLPLNRIKNTLHFICQHQRELNDPAFVKKHFEFIRWYPDKEGAERFKHKSNLIAHIPADKILMTKYYTHLAKGSKTHSASHPYALMVYRKMKQC